MGKKNPAKRSAPSSLRWLTLSYVRPDRRDRKDFVWSLIESTSRDGKIAESTHFPTEKKAQAALAQRIQELLSTITGSGSVYVVVYQRSGHVDTATYRKSTAGRVWAEA